LGSDYCYETKIGYSGTIQDGTLNGNLYIIGGGDPTIGSIDSIAVKTNATFAQWEKMIKNAGIKKIDAHIIGDGRWVEGEVEETSWSWQDIGTYYGTGVTGLMFYENMLSYNILPGKELGEPIELNASYPKTPWMTINNEATTGKAGTGDQTYMYTSEFAPVGAVRGTFAIDRGKKRVDFSNKFPEYTCAHYFMNHLKKKGIQSGGAGDFRLDTAWEQHGEIHILGKTYSPTLARIAFETNHASNNLYPETLFRGLSR
jgi:D-alanyl-D-alanine carboxypeptidase/D-alanyl-D-alanine-endopeptidase (penicillin-binding protein 4)